MGKWKTYKAGRRSTVQDVAGPSWWEAWGKPALIGVTVVTFIIGVIVAAVMTDAKQDRAWNEWCESQGGTVERWSRTPPDQRRGTGGDHWFCLVDGRAVGSR